MAYTMGYGNNKALDKKNKLNYICYGNSSLKFEYMATQP